MGTNQDFNKTLRACNLCHQRKVKCGKQKPSCSNCLKKNALCQYPEDTINKHSKAAKKKKSTGKDCCQESDIIDFHTCIYQSPVHLSQGALTWVALLKKDRFINVIVLNHHFKSILVEKQKYDAENKKKEIPIEFVNKWNKGLDLFNIDEIYHNGNCSDSYGDANLILEIKKYLNNSKLVWTSVDFFFKSAYCLIFPYINKDDFIDQLVKLIGDPNYTSEPINLRITKTEQLSVIGTLLLMMKFISISGYNFGKPLSNIDALKRFILDYPIDRNDVRSIYSIILRIYQEVTNLRLHSLHIFQFFCMKFSYELYSPEEQDCLTIANGRKLGELYQYAIQCSLNIDPDFSNKSLNNDIQRKNLSRNLWYMVVFWDISKFFDIGDPPLIDESFYNTKLPNIEESSTEIEKVINTSIKERMEFYNNFKPILQLMLNLKQNPAISKIKYELEQLKTLIQTIPTLDEIMEKPSEVLLQRYENFKQLMFLLQSHTMLFIIYYHLFIHYNETQNVKKSLDYLIKSIKTAKVIFKSLLFMDPRAEHFSLQKHFGPATLAFPRIEASVHKISILFLSILSRIKAFKLMKGVYIDSEKLVILDSMADVSHAALSYIMRQYVGTSNVYYHTWIVSRLNITIAYKILSIPKGPFLQSDYTYEDFNFKQSLESTAAIESDEIKGDLGFENHSCDDLKKILDEMTDLLNGVDLNVRPSSSLSQKEPYIKKKKTFKENDLNNITQDFGYSPPNRVDALQSLQLDSLLNNPFHVEGLDSLANGPTLDELFNHSIDNFFGFRESGNYI